MTASEKACLRSERFVYLKNDMSFTLVVTPLVCHFLEIQETAVPLENLIIKKVLKTLMSYVEVNRNCLIQLEDFYADLEIEIKVNTNAVPSLHNFICTVLVTAK